MKNVVHFFCLLILLLPKPITLRWHANRESDLAGYNLYYGYRPSQYIKKIDVGLWTQVTFSDLHADTDYFFSVTAYDMSGNESDFSKELRVRSRQVDDDTTRNSSNVYSANFPNPFNPIRESTRIHYTLTNPANVTLKIFNIRGELVRTIAEHQTQHTGDHDDDAWDGRDDAGNYVQNGAYICEVQMAKRREYFKIIVLK